MGDGRRGLAVKWLAGICGMLFVGAGNVIGVMAHGLAVAGGMIWESANLLRWLVTCGLWAVGGVLTAVIYALGAAMQRIDVLELWLSSLDTAVRNREMKH